MNTFIVERNELHQAWAKVTYEIEANSQADALQKLSDVVPDGTNQGDVTVAFFIFDEFEVGPSISVETETTIEEIQ